MSDWHVSFHGTTLDNYNSISACGMKLMKPGEQTVEGKTIAIRSGHFTKDMLRKCPYTGKIIDHSVSRIFSSPCICYA